MVPKSPPAAPNRGDDQPWFLQGGGVSGQAARAVSWAETPLGPAARWPPTLKTTLATMFCSRQPMFLWWGPELIQFYNDAYLPSFGHGKHPRAMGQRGRECWREIWSIIGPQIEDVMERAMSSLSEDALIPIQRNGRMEDVYWTYTYSPVFGEGGAVAGTLVICTETTNRVLVERRTNILHTLVAQTSVASDAAGLIARVLTVLGDASADIPFVAIYDRHPGEGRLTTLESLGIADSAALAIGARAAAMLGAGDGRRYGEMPLGDAAALSSKNPGDEPIRDAYVASLGEYDGVTESFIVLGISAKLTYDDSYRRFFEQVTGYLRVAKTRVDEAKRRVSAELDRRNLLEQAPVAAALLVGPTHVFEIANTLYRRVVGRPDIVGMSYHDAFPELINTPLPGILDHVYETGEPFITSEYPVAIDRHASGVVEQCFFRFNLEPVRDARGRVYGMMAVAVDISEQVMGRRVLESAQAEREGLLRSLEAANRAKDEFLAMLGHELRNPLSPIVTALQLMRRKAEGQISREQQIIERQVDHLVGLVDDLLDVAKIARGKVDLRREVVDLCDVVTRAVEMASDLLERRHHQLSIDCERRRFYCNADAVRLSQVFANLLTNAARYTDPGGSISLKVWQADGQLGVAVKDSGIGISAEMLPRIFNLFEQGKRSSDRAEGGLGLGLTLVKNLVTLHGGTVSAKSDGVGQGTELTVWLPALIPGARPAVAPPRRALADFAGAKRLLLVDDNLDAAELLQLALEQRGHQVMAATDPLAALDLAVHFLPEIAVLDIGLPGMDGYELGARLRALPGLNGCRLIALTGYGQDHDRQRSRAAGFEHHLVKPINMDNLLRIIESPAPATGDPDRRPR